MFADITVITFKNYIFTRKNKVLLKVLHINQSDSTGGAAVAAIRLINALRANGTHAEMLVLERSGHHPAIHPVVKTKMQRFVRNARFYSEVLSFVPHEKNRKQRFAFSSGRFGYDISKNQLVQNADILHLHWVNQGFLSLQDLRKLINTGKPIVWTLHDTWPFTGGCHYPGNCGGFTSTCGQCPLLRSPGEQDLSARQHKQKEDMYTNASLTFVGCSKWMKEMADKSSLVRKDLKHAVKQVFNPIDTMQFSPGDVKLVRRALNLPENKKLLLFGAANTADPRKGTGFLLRALKQICLNYPHLYNELELVAFGKNIGTFEENVPLKLHAFHMVNSLETMAQLYQAADLFVLPSMQDNLPNTVVESMACGTPVVAFNIGGVPEMVAHEQSGFLAEPGKWRDLGNGILSAIKNGEVWGANARAFAENHFSPETIAAQYQEIYQTIHRE